MNKSRPRSFRVNNMLIATAVVALARPDRTSLPYGTSSASPCIAAEKLMKINDLVHVHALDRKAGGKNKRNIALRCVQLYGTYKIMSADPIALKILCMHV